MTDKKRSRKDEADNDNGDTNIQNKVYININELICPITREIFNRPVTANDGFTYEEWAISKCLSGDEDENKSPMTRESITSYHENKIVKTLVNQLLELRPELKEEQFDQEVYNDYLKNRECCIKLLGYNNFIKFSCATDIRLLDNTGSNGYVIAYLSKNCRDVEIFENILKNSFDLNCRNREGCTPMYYIAKYASKDIIIMSIKAGAEPFNLSTRYGPTNIINLINENKDISEDDKMKIIYHLLDNNLFIKVFINDPIIIIVCQEFEELFQQIMKKIINDDALYKLIGLDFIVEMINSDITYVNLNYILDGILSLDLSTEKIYEYYTDNSRKKFTYMNQHVGYIYEGIRDSDEYDDDQKITLLRKIKELLEKVNIDKIDAMLLNYNTEKQHEIIRNNKEMHIRVFDEFMNK